jgi:hypothetical protein
VCNQQADASGRAAAYAELVSALLDLRRSAPTQAFDRVLGQAVTDGHLTEELARQLKWLQRQSLHELVAHAEHVLPATLVALEGTQEGGADLASPDEELQPDTPELPAADPPPPASPFETAPPPAPAPTAPVADWAAAPTEPTPPIDLTSRRLLVAGLRPIAHPPLP